MKGRYLVDDIVKIMINLNSGESKGTAWGCDLSKKYVEINSEYTTLVLVNLMVDIHLYKETVLLKFQLQNL